MKNYPDFLLRKDDLDDGKKWGKDRRLRRMVDPRVECKNKKKNLFNEIHYGNTGRGVFKRGVKIRKIFA